jgi:hypothetical protein
MCSVLLTSDGFAQTPGQTDQMGNVFFGFDFVLTPLTIKWGCGGARAQDLAVIDRLIAAHPADAEQAEIRTLVDETLRILDNDISWREAMGIGGISDAQWADLCDVARPLRILWATPDALANGTGGQASDAQTAAWQTFYRHLENLQ